MLVERGVELLAELYHWYVPPGPDAVNVALVPEQIVVPLTVGSDGCAVTFTVTAVRGLTQPLDDVAWT